MKSATRWMNWNDCWDCKADKNAERKMWKKEPGSIRVCGDEWMIKSFDEVFEDATKLGVKIKTDEYHPIGKYQIIDQGQEAVAGYSDLEDGVFENVPAIVFGDHTRIVKYVDQPFFLGADGVKVLRSRFKDANYRYLYYALKSMKIPNTGYNRHFKWLKEAKIYYPNSEEQSKIVLILDEISSVIEHRQRQLQKLDELVKARFVEMFGDVIYNDRKWECKQFSDITTSRLGKMLDTKHQTGTCKYPYLANFNVQWFRFELNNLNEMDFNEKDREEFCLEDGDLLVCEGGEIGRCAVWHNQVKKCFFQKALHRVRCNQNIILPDYLSWWFKYNCENGGLAAIEGAKATISHLTGAKMKMLDVAVPPIELQEQFVDFIKQVDKSKVAVQKALDEAQLLFDSLMQQYFG